MKVVPILPVDITPEEIAILGTISASLYTRFPDVTDKFIVAMHYEMGYSLTEVALALEISIPAVSNRNKKIRAMLDSLKK